MLAKEKQNKTRSTRKGSRRGQRYCPMPSQVKLGPVNPFNNYSSFLLPPASGNHHSAFSLYDFFLKACKPVCMCVKKQQLEPDVKQQPGSKLGKEYKAVYCHPLI